MGGGGGGGLIGQLSRHNDGSKQVVQARTAKSGQWREKTYFWITFVARGVGQTAHIFGYTVVFHPEIICKQCKELKGSSLAVH